MAIELSASKCEIFFECGSLGPPALIVTAFSGVEAISELFSFEIDLASEDAQIDFSAVVGQAATLSWTTSAGERFVSGIVATFEQRGGGTRYSYYRARLVPKAWMLTLRQNSKIFQGDDVKKIVSKVLQGFGFADGDDFTFAKYVAAHPAREYCVQYRETDWDFISRLCEEEGISYFFRHEQGKHTLVFTDEKSAFEPIEGDSTIPFRLASGMVDTAEAIYNFGYTESVRTGKVVLRDYLFTNPSLDLTTDPVTASTDTNLEVYDYPGNFDNKGWGGTLASYKGAGFRAQRALGKGESDVRAFIPGFTLTMAEHPRDDRNGPYLITRVQHWGDQRQSLGEDASNAANESPYGNSFECVPAATDYRPERLTPRPIVEGSQTALVCGPSGEEIWVDKYGRIKVQFHWDRLGAKDDKSTCWVRVSQAWAGAGWGITFWPRIGMEVVIDFLEGDPDHPLVTGCVYNGLNPVPYTLADEKTKSTIKSNSTPGGGGFNELRFEDAKGSEQVYIHAQKDMDTMVENNRTVTVGNDEEHTVGHDRTVHVKHDQTHTVDNERVATVKANDTETVEMSQTISVYADQSTTVGGSRSVDVTATDTINVLAARSLSIGAASSINVGGAEAVKIGATLDHQVGGNVTLKVGGDRSLEVAGNESVTITGDDALQVAGNWSGTVSGDSTWETTGNLSMKAKKIAIEAKDEIAIKVGSAEITMKSDGTIDIKGKDISLDGSGKITVKGQTVKLN